jgi:hypothetical protein
VGISELGHLSLFKLLWYTSWLWCPSEFCAFTHDGLTHIATVDYFGDRWEYTALLILELLRLDARDSAEEILHESC